MSIIFRDLRAAKDEVHEAIRAFEKDKNFDRLMTEIEAFRATVPLNKSFLRHCLKLAMAGASDKIHRLVDVIDDKVLRAWIRLPILLLIWPFMLIARIIKLGLP